VNLNFFDDKLNNFGYKILYFKKNKLEKNTVRVLLPFFFAAWKIKIQKIIFLREIT
jgi:hypothetical protein